MQVNFLGYPGTTGASYIDYLIADRHVIPDGAASAYSEKIVYLPDSYQPNDLKRFIEPRSPTRQEQGLPDSGFVFCSFNSNYKITPDIFDVWMRLLQSVDGSVLWLFRDNMIAGENLKREAEKRGGFRRAACLRRAASFGRASRTAPARGFIPRYALL